MRSPGVLILLSSTLVIGSACDSGTKPAEGQANTGQAGAAASEAKPAGAAEAPTKPAAEPEAATKPGEPAAKQPKAPAKPPVDEVAKLRKQLLALLNEGRTLTKNGDYAGGIAKYREALKIDASDVSVLGELGWAAFKSGDLELAHRTTVQALKHVRDDKRRGMLLYNLGRVEEQREEWDAAIDSYEASLKARPNKTVEDRLAALREQLNQMAVAGSAGGELQGPTVADASLEPLARDLADLAAACKQLEADRCEDYTLEPDEPCTCAPTLLAAPAGDDSWGLLSLGEVDGSMQVAWFPVVKTDAGWTVFSEVYYSYNPGAFGIYEEVQLQPSAVAGAGADAILQLRASKSRNDSDMGINEIENESLDSLVVCTRTGGVARCSKALVTEYMYDRDILFEGEDEQMAGEPIDHEGLPIRRGLKQTIELRDGKLIVTRTETAGGFDTTGDLWGNLGWILSAGEHTVASVVSGPGDE